MAPSARGRAGGVQCSLLVLALAAPLASAGLGSAQHAALTGAPHFGSVAPLFGFALGGDRPLPSYTVSQPDPGSTLTQIRWPMCFGKHSAMRLRGGGRRAAAGGGVRVRRPDPGAFGTIRSSLAEAEDGGPPPAPLPPLSLPPLSR